MSGAGKKAFEGLTRGILAARRKRMDALDAETRQQKAVLDHQLKKQALADDVYETSPPASRKVLPEFVPLVELGLTVPQIQGLGISFELLEDWQGRQGVSGADAFAIRSDQERRAAEHIEQQDRQRAEAREREASRQRVYSQAYNAEVEKAKEQFRTYRDAARRGEEGDWASFDAVRVVVPEHAPDGGFSDWLEGARLQQVALVSPEQAARARAVAQAAVEQYDKETNR